MLFFTTKAAFFILFSEWIRVLELFCVETLFLTSVNYECIGVYIYCTVKRINGSNESFVLCVFCLFELRNSLQDVIYKMVVYRINQWALQAFLRRGTTSTNL